MARSLEFLALGEQRADAVPLTCVPLAAPNATALYKRRLEAVRASGADYVCFVDGGDDVCLPGFVDAMQALADSGAPLGYAVELVHGELRETPVFTLPNFLRDHSIIHHGVVCDREALLAINWPDGCYSWETIAYGSLAQRGFVRDDTPRYDWRPGPTGARLWPTYAIGVVYAKRWLQGLPCKHAKLEA